MSKFFEELLKGFSAPSFDRRTHYRCSICGGIFEKGQSDEAATKERERDFQGFSAEECEVVCDDCYKDFMEWLRLNRH